MKRHLFYKYLLNMNKDYLLNYLNHLDDIVDPKSFKLIVNSNLNALAKSVDFVLLPLIVKYIDSEKLKNKVDIYSTLFNQPAEVIESILMTENSHYYSLIYHKIRKFNLHINQFFNRLKEDYKQILAYMNYEPNSTITMLNFSSGDDHNQGQRACVVSLSNGKGFVYKPTHNYLDDVISSIMQKYATYPKQKKKLLHKKDAIGDYTYIELIPTNNNAKTKEELKQFFYNYGELLAFGEFFCITDGHYENLIVNMPEVHWIDLETSLNVKEDFSLEDTILIQELNEANSKRGIISPLQKPNNFDIVIAHPFVHNDETDDMHLSYINEVEYKTYNSMVTLNGNSISINDYSIYVQMGYESSVNNILNYKKDIIEELITYIDGNNIFVRCLILNTVSYIRYNALYSNAMYDKKDILDFIKKERLETLQFNNLLSTEDMQKLLNTEIMDITNLSIPYFYRKINSKSLFHISGLEIKNYFSENLKDKLRVILENYNPKIDTNKENIHKSLSLKINNLEDFKQLFNWDKDYVFD